MRIRPLVPAILTAALVLAPSSRAFAFGGTADELGHQGNFVVSNEANVGFHHTFATNAGTSFTLQPALDYFVIQNLSLGGSVLFSYESGGGQSVTAFGAAPEIGYEIPLGDTWSFWPRASVGFQTFAPSPGAGSTTVFVSINAPFLIHPAEHFFFGAGPGFTVDFAGNNNAASIDVSFFIGGYFGG